jgi:hypothetical protein
VHFLHSVTQPIIHYFVIRRKPMNA